MALLRIVTLVVVVAGLVASIAVRLMGGGWLLFVPLYLAAYFGVLLSHVLLSLFVIGAAQSPRCLWLTMASTVMLLAAFCLQTDYGDGGVTWFVFDAMLNRQAALHQNRIPGWWTETVGLLPMSDLWLFIPAVVTWYVTARCLMAELRGEHVSDST